MVQLQASPRLSEEDTLNIIYTYIVYCHLQIKWTALEKLKMVQLQTSPRHSEEDTVKSEIFARVLCSRNFADAKFREYKTRAKWQNHSVVY